MNQEDAFTRARTVRAEIVRTITVAGQPLSVDVSIGIAMLPDHGRDFRTVHRHAEIALRQSKQAPGGVATYTPAIAPSRRQQLTLLTDLRGALDQSDDTGLQPYYQAQIDLATGEVEGVEALLRWRHPTRGMISPEELIRVAEHSPVMSQLTRWMAEQVLRQQSRWRSQGVTLRTSLNVSVTDLYNSSIVGWLRDLLDGYGVAPSDLQVEITESALMAEPNSVLACLQALRQLGVGVALDDFGTGYSSLQHLYRLPLTEIKIDKSFTRVMVEDAAAAGIVRHIIGLGRELGLRVVAEGVEDDTTRARLLADGCHVGQGWYYAKALPADDFDRWLAARAPTPDRSAHP